MSVGAPIRTVTMPAPKVLYQDQSKTNRVFAFVSAPLELADNEEVQPSHGGAKEHAKKSGPFPTVSSRY